MRNRISCFRGGDYPPSCLTRTKNDLLKCTHQLLDRAREILSPDDCQAVLGTVVEELSQRLAQEAGIEE
jgi:hypothetical protein